MEQSCELNDHIFKSAQSVGETVIMLAHCQREMLNPMTTEVEALETELVEAFCQNGFPRRKDDKSTKLSDLFASLDYLIYEKWIDWENLNKQVRKIYDTHFNKR